MLIDLVRRVAETSPDHPFVVSADRTLTYGQCLDQSLAIARGLGARSIDRAGCMVRDAAELITLLCASSAAGTELCVYSPALGPLEADELAEALGHHLVITDGAPTDLRTPAVPWAALAMEDGAPPPAPERSLTLILTTGTTGRPKGARHDWSRLVAAVRRREGTQRERWLLAYNLNQFAGIQVVLHALVGGSTLVVPQSNQPRDALSALRDLGVTHASATPTFWRFVVALLDEPQVDLPLEQLTLGGEAIPSALLPELRRLFPAARISQIYASTELGSSVSVRDGKHGLPLSVLDRGDDADVQFRIIDGELHARSRVGMLGYAGQQDDGSEWRATGDLVEVQGDRIVFTGRTSDIINVGGVKVHPLTVEEAIATVDGVELARVYGRSNPMAGQIVAVDVVARPEADHDVVADAIREACARLPEAAWPRRIKFVDTLATREHKVVRLPNTKPEAGA